MYTYPATPGAGGAGIASGGLLGAFLGLFDGRAPSPSDTEPRADLMVNRMFLSGGGCADLGAVETASPPPGRYRILPPPNGGEMKDGDGGRRFTSL
jgi:hypothetical protein